MNERSSVLSLVILATQLGSKSIELKDKTRFCKFNIPHNPPPPPVVILLMPHRVHSRVIVDERLLKMDDILSKLGLSEKRSVVILDEKNLEGNKSARSLLLLASTTEIRVEFESVHGSVVKKLLFMFKVDSP